MNYRIVNVHFMKLHMPNICVTIHSRNCPLFELKEGRTYSVRNMSDAELREAIIEDLLTMARIGIGYVSLTELTRLITSRDQLERIREQMGHPDVTSRVLRVGDRFKIRFTKGNMADSLNFVGIYDTIFNPLAEA